MDLAVWMDTLPTIGLAIALAACTGLRAWMPLLLGGLLARAGYLELGAGYRFLASDRALVVFALATLIEVVGDKVPVVDHALDSLSTVLRPAAGSLLAASVLWQVKDPLTALAMGTAVGAPSALAPHAAKSAFRALSTALTAGLGNPVLSILEDLAVFVFFLFAVLVPMLAALGFLALAFVIVRRLARLRFAVRTT